MTSNNLQIHPTPPFAFDLTADNQPYFRRGAGGTQDSFQRLLDLGDKLALATVVFNGDVHNPVLSVSFSGPRLGVTEHAAAGSQLARLLGTEQDLAPFYHHVADDPVMASLTCKFHGLHQTLSLSVFETLAQAILGQQLSASVARVIRGLLVETYGPSLEMDGVRHYTFPRPAAIAGATVEELRALKLSQRKAEYLQGLAMAELEPAGGLDWVSQLPDDEVVKEVTSLRGVGNWSAQWVLSRALGRPDAFPLGDLALRRIVSQLYFASEPITDAELEEFSLRWAPFRSLATTYLFAALRAGLGRPVTGAG